MTVTPAATAAIPVALNIHGLVLHPAARAEIALERVTTGESRDIPVAGDFAATGDWPSDVAKLFAASGRLAAHI